MSDFEYSSKTAIPKGVRVFPPEETALRRLAERQILTVFERWGFHEVIIPTFEYLEVFSGDSEGEGGDKIFKFVDRQTGRLLALRYDPTPQVARLAATTLRYRPLPLRLSYVTNIFRYEAPQSGRQRECVQLGVELIGLQRPEADAEMVAMAVEGCRALGLQRFQIDVGQIEYVRGLVDALGPAPDRRRALVSAIDRKDTLEIELLLRGLDADDKSKQAVLDLPTLYGGKEVLARAQDLAPNRRSQEALKNLAQVYEVLEQYGLADQVIIDLGEARAFEYHTGVTFTAFAQGLGSEISRGGRYDDLIGGFGYPCPATGFAFDMEKVLEAVAAEGRPSIVTGQRFLIIDFNPDKRYALRIARLLREQGYSAARDIIKRDLQGSFDYAIASGIGRAIVLGLPHLPQDELLIRDLASGAEERVPVERFCGEVERGERRWPM
ncbi:ATP phosphoribosyltransferase regulatory subunit [Candidatus Methylomirabilis sp.]|uniref:ATP phosphoribosyltransferase regulatory subunit n=1 Tax=Candidatus Methylomirabilis tolerans TaxID=3123416 RepID=A0AAJ1AHW3_9BACT|nr:ATP phosphoribosyltransferase regulatory subunit [Candidatus Methylomirabilis sp.]